MMQVTYFELKSWCREVNIELKMAAAQIFSPFLSAQTQYLVYKGVDNAIRNSSRWIKKPPGLSVDC